MVELMVMGPGAFGNVHWCHVDGVWPSKFATTTANKKNKTNKNKNYMPTPFEQFWYTNNDGNTNKAWGE